MFVFKNVWCIKLLKLDLLTKNELKYLIIPSEYWIGFYWLYLHLYNCRYYNLCSLSLVYLAPIICITIILSTHLLPFVKFTRVHMIRVQVESNCRNYSQLCYMNYFLVTHNCFLYHLMQPFLLFLCFGGNAVYPYFEGWDWCFSKICLWHSVSSFI